MTAPSVGVADTHRSLELNVARPAVLPYCPRCPTDMSPEALADAGLWFRNGSLLKTLCTTQDSPMFKEFCGVSTWVSE